MKNQPNPRTLWNIINSAIGRKANPPAFPPKLIQENSPEIQKTELATKFNNFFCNIGPNLAKRILPTNKSASFFLNIPDSLTHNMVFHLQPVCVDTVLRKLETLKENKSSGADGISPKLLKLGAQHLAAPLTHLINESLAHGQVPTAMKIAKVLPIYKGKGDQTECSNYRLISVLTVVSKVLESIVNEQLQTYLADNSIITLKQCGLSKGKSTKDALIAFTENTLFSVNKETLS